jgi:hypothetical protein
MHNDTILSNFMALFLFICKFVLTLNIQISDRNIYIAVRLVYCVQSCLDWLQTRSMQRRRVCGVRIVGFWLVVGCMNDV